MKQQLTYGFLFSLWLSFASGCQRAEVKTTHRDATAAPAIAVTLDSYLRTEYPPADGFDFAIGDANGKGAYVDAATGKQHEGWYVATKFNEQYALGLHPAEDWNGRGGGNTDMGQPVYAVAHGRVKFAAPAGQPWGNVVIVEHTFYENHERREILSLYAHLQTMAVKKGEIVKRRQRIATIGQDPDKTFAAHLHLELRWDATLAPTYWPSSNGKDAAWIREHYAAPTAFIQARRKLFVPQNEATLVLVDQDQYKMQLYQRGKLAGAYDISLGQAKGQKRVQGDNKTPKGMYFVIHKHRGKFDGAYGAYYGGHWIKLNYPNRYDAARGKAEGLLNDEQVRAIATNWEARQATNERTRLGGGIGFHGWAAEWPNDGPRHLSWGCVVMHLYDIRKVFDEIPSGAMVVIF
ncbi:MAG: peptidoglycan DD-metalloendopeptidase family protein [Acidobacteria bacterium]|nr:peptidoglycan DD-metalloendopeptidase family protein [Acidobacteriota bacterium]